MAKGGRDRSASNSRSPSGKKGKVKRKDRSRSRSESRGKKNANKKRPSPGRSRSRSRKKRGRSRSAQKRRSPSRKKKKSPSLKRKERKPSPKRAAKPTLAAAIAGVRGAAKKADNSPDRPQRASPSPLGRYDRGGSASRSRSRSSRSRSKSADEPAPKELEVVGMQLSERPFGMAPSKEAGVSGYVVAKVAEEKPAATAGVCVGWRLVSIAGKPCRDLDLEGIQVLLKGADLPVAVEFEREKEGGPPKGSEDGDSDEEMDMVLDSRAEYRKSHQAGIDALDELPVTRSPEDLPQPISDWQEGVDRKYLNKSLLDKLVAAGLKRPTLIQRHAVPVIMHEQGHWDMIASAQTGSGKTFAFVIPTVARLVVEGAMPRPFFPGASAQACPLVLILSPTRELAMQTNKEIEVMTKGTALVPLCLYGGESLKFQQKKLVERQTDIICATPGRLCDLVDAGKISLSFIQSVVLDEADQMFEQSLEIMCTEILTGRDMPEPAGRQTLLFSATMPQKVRDLCPRLLKPIASGQTANLTVGHYTNDKGGGCASIKQILRWVPEENSRMMAMVQDLHHLWINQGRKGRVVIFTNQRLQAGNLATCLNKNGISCLHLHGKLEQHVREEVFDNFRKGAADVLVATNVASRGLDFQNVTFVVQYNLPGTIDIYTHRIGRTGRVGEVGCALSYVGPKDRHLFGKMAEFLELNNQEVPNFICPQQERYPPRRGGGGRRSPSRGRRRSPPRRYGR